MSIEHDSSCPYQTIGYENRIHYLKSLAETSKVPINIVLKYAKKFGRSCDFCILVQSISAISKII